MSATVESIQTKTGDIHAGPWQDFTGGRWQDQIDVRDFIQANVTPYTGDAAFLAGPTERTSALRPACTRSDPQGRRRSLPRL